MVKFKKNGAKSHATTIPEQWKKVVIGEMPPRMVSIQAEQACAIIYPTVRTDMIVAHVATYAEFQVNSEELNSGRFSGIISQATNV